MVEFQFSAHSIFRAGLPSPFTLQLWSIWGTAADGTAVALQAQGVVAVIQPYRLEDFAESPRFTVAGTVTGLAGVGLELELATEGRRNSGYHPPPPPWATARSPSPSRPWSAGTPYEVRVKTQPTNPVQVCTVNNASGTIEDANVTNVEVNCV